MATAAPQIASTKGVAMTARPRVVVKPGTTVVFLGDSNTAETRVWFRGFREGVDKLYRDRGATPVTWVNSGVSGGGMSPSLDSSVCLSTSANRTALVNDFNPHTLVIACGVNDVNFASPWDQPTFETALGDSIDNYLANCSHLIAAQILLLPSVYNGEPSGSKETEMNQVATGMSNVATAKGTRFRNVRTPRPTLGGMTVDGIHLTEAGKAYLCQQLSEAVAIG